ncbi:hypothetical protein CQA53_11090, partial [Helicobacter didelphidarum]
LIKLFQLENFWGHADEPYNPKEMTTKQENINFYNNEFSKFDKKGVVAMVIEGWNNAKGHITLWNGAIKQFIDDNNPKQSKNYLTLIQSTNNNIQMPIVKKLYFWELL